MFRRLTTLVLFVGACSTHSPVPPAAERSANGSVNPALQSPPRSVSASMLMDGVKRNADDLMRWSYRARLWDDTAPSSNSHRLLACGVDCESSRTGGPLVDAWIAATNESGLSKLHRGEFLASLAASGVALERSLPGLSDATVGSRLDTELEVALESNSPPWNAREATHGVEFGWLLQAACRYHGASLGVPPEQARRLLSAAMASSMRAATEAGTHELEGLATCLQAHASGGPAELDPTYDAVHSFLTDKLDADLGTQTLAAQIYDEADTFDTCDGEMCQILDHANRQAHFFEWAALMPGIEDDPRIARPLERLRDLTRQAIERLPPTPEGDTWLPLLASAASHTAHIAGNLR